MISYKEFIDLMKVRGYILKSPVAIDESNPSIKTFSVKKDTIGKFLEFSCPNNTIISACGKTHPGGCNSYYSFNIKCFNKDNEESFQRDSYRSIPLTPDSQIVAEIIVTKILQKELDKNDPKVQENSNINSAILKIIRSENSYEYPMRSGVYKFISRDFLERSFNLHSNEKMILYAINPDTDIFKTKLEMKVDILELNT
jgi:hypothetical protein